MERYYNNKKRRMLKRKVIRFMSVFTIIVFILAIAFVLSSKPNITKASENIKGTKCYKSITLSSGDSLWSIAEEYMEPSEYISVNDYINEIISINSLISDNLIAGNSLIIPYYCG